jgi:ammonium transporter Rh
MNKVLLVFGYLQAEDVGGTITIHMFGAYFGLAASWALGPPPSLAAAQEDKVSDIFALVGTGILWVYWPSFVGATETSHDVYAQRCLSNTVWSLAASTAATFYMSHRLSRRRKFDPVHIANATLAGGVAMGTSARLVTSPGAAIALGALAGALSVIGYVYLSPFLLKRFGIADSK